MPKVWDPSTHSWYNPDDIQREILAEQRRTNQLLTEMKNRNLFAPEERHEIDEKKKPLVIVFDADGPKSYCIKCDTEAVFDKIERKYFCPHCRRRVKNNWADKPGRLS